MGMYRINDILLKVPDSKTQIPKMLLGFVVSVLELQIWALKDKANSPDIRKQTYGPLR
jgi:hypothetical protein